MLKIYFGDYKEAIYNTTVYFKNTYQDAWITDEFSKQMIEDVDKSIVLGAHIIEMRVLSSFLTKEGDELLNMMAKNSLI